MAEPNTVITEHLTKGAKKGVSGAYYIPVITVEVLFNKGLFKPYSCEKGGMILMEAFRICLF